MAFDPGPAEIADRYVDSRNRVVDLARGISPDQATLPVPGTPRWTVIELLSHLVGCGIDLSAQKFHGAGSQEWTQAQIESRRGRSVGDLLTEWDDNLAGIERGIRDGIVPVPITFDVITHEQDLRGAIDAPVVSEPLTVGFVADGFATRASRVVEKAGLAPLELRDDASGWSVGAPGGVCWSGSQFELFRAMAGRRSVGQVTAMSWTGDPSAYLDTLCPFGPLPQTDVED